MKKKRILIACLLPFIFCAQKMNGQNLYDRTLFFSNPYTQSVETAEEPIYLVSNKSYAQMLAAAKTENKAVCVLICDSSTASYYMASKLLYNKALHDTLSTHYKLKLIFANDKDAVTLNSQNFPLPCFITARPDVGITHYACGNIDENIAGYLLEKNLMTTKNFDALNNTAVSEHNDRDALFAQALQAKLLNRDCNDLVQKFLIATEAEQEKDELIDAQIHENKNYSNDIPVHEVMNFNKANRINFLFVKYILQGAMHTGFYDVCNSIKVYSALYGSSEINAYILDAVTHTCASLPADSAMKIDALLNYCATNNLIDHETLKSISILYVPNRVAFTYATPAVSDSNKILPVLLSESMDNWKNLLRLSQSFINDENRNPYLAEGYFVAAEKAYLLYPDMYTMLALAQLSSLTNRFESANELALSLEKEYGRSPFFNSAVRKELNKIKSQ